MGDVGLVKKVRVCSNCCKLAHGVDFDEEPTTNPKERDELLGSGPISLDPKPKFVSSFRLQEGFSSLGPNPPSPLFFGQPVEHGEVVFLGVVCVPLKEPCFQEMEGASSTLFMGVAGGIGVPPVLATGYVDLVNAVGAPVHFLPPRGEVKEPLIV